MSANRVAVNPENIEKVQKWPIPQSDNDMERFLGFANYHHDHIKNYAEVTAVLCKLTGKNASFVWDEVHQVAFDSVKEKLVNALILI